MIYNYDLEQHLLSGLLQHPDSFFEISPFISESDFYSESSLLNKSIFFVTRSSLEKGEVLDEILISDQLRSLGISFEEGIDPLEYIQALFMRKMSFASVLKTAKELKKVTIRREISQSGIEISKAMNKMANSSYDEIVNKADELYHKRINIYESSESIPENLYEVMEEKIEERGNNPIDDFGLAGPHNRLHEIYGSLLRPGNISVVVARSGIGKTQFCMDFCSKVSASNDHIPILHFDNGEMSKEELIFRQCAAMTKVPVYLLESGNWRKSGKETVEKVRSVFADLKKQYRHLYYYNIGGMNIDKQISVLKRFYYSKVGRGNPLIFSFDYIKTTSENVGNKNEWQVVGEMVDKYKKCIQRDIKNDEGPCISMITSVQSNRTGIVTNRAASNVVDDESIVSLSDRITQFCSHMFILRNKTSDELQEEPSFGTHKLINVKARHLGKDIAGAINQVRMPDDTLRKNFVNLEFENFSITEKGDLRDIAESQLTTTTLLENANSDIPDLD